MIVFEEAAFGEDHTLAIDTAFSKEAPFSTGTATIKGIGKSALITSIEKADPILPRRILHACVRKSNSDVLVMRIEGSDSCMIRA